METWKDIPGYEGYYQISTLGNVRSVDREVVYDSGRVAKRTGKLMKVYRGSTYASGSVGLCKGGYSISWAIDKLMVKTFIDPTHTGPIYHLDMDITNNCLDNVSIQPPNISATSDTDWADVFNFEGVYQVSRYGQVRSIDRYVRSKNGSVKFSKGVILDPQLNNGYLWVTLANNGGKQKYQSVHRLVAEAFIPNPENKPQVNHKDGNKVNNVVENLEWVTAKENCIHSVDTGLFRCNEENLAYQNSLRAKPVKNNVDGKTFASIADAARFYNLNPSTVSTWVNGQYTSRLGYDFEFIERGDDV